MCHYVRVKYGCLTALLTAAEACRGGLLCMQKVSLLLNTTWSAPEHTHYTHTLQVPQSHTCRAMPLLPHHLDAQALARPHCPYVM